MSKIFRSIQVYFPFLQDLKYKLRFGKMKLLKRVHDDDFELMKWFQPSSDQVFVDIGSNRGEAITSMLIMSKSKTKIIGFEPNFQIFKKLEGYLSREKNVILHNIGLGDSQTSKKLYTPIYLKWIFDGLASFKHEYAKNWLQNRMYFFRENFLLISESNCNIETLDNFNLNPYFIKIDVQGFEPEVLKGAKETLTKHTPILLIESLNKECAEYLMPLGYKFYSYGKEGLKEGFGNLNTFCIVQKNYPELKKLLK